jgi:hypothetical protein
MKDNAHNTARQVGWLLIALWAFLIVNWCSGLNLGMFLFESPRLQAISQLIWFLLPWPCLLLWLVVGTNRIKVVSITAIPIWVLVTALSLIPIGTSLYQMYTGEYAGLTVEEFHRVGARTGWYKYDCWALGRHPELVRTETLIMPGLLWVHTLEDQRWNMSY